MGIWTAVHGYKDGDNSPLNAETLNKPLHALTMRTDYLNNRIKALAGDSPFELVRLTDVKLTELNTPDIGDIVYRSADGTGYAKALANVDFVDEFTVGQSAYAVGMLIAKRGTTGTIAFSGHTTLPDKAPADIIESSEIFRPGPYYLSSVEHGKLTAYPSGPRIYVCSIMGSDNEIESVIVDVQLRDTGESHVHRAYKLHAKPVGQQIITSDDHDGKHIVVGKDPDGYLGFTNNDYNDRIPRIVLEGTWLSRDDKDVTYTIWLSKSAELETSPELSYAPMTWGETYLHWVSSDITEGTKGKGVTKLRSFEIPVAVGDHGLKVILEANAEQYSEQEAWSIPYNVENPGASEYLLRTWTVTLPEDGEGWLANNHRYAFNRDVELPGGFSVRTLGGPRRRSDNANTRVYIKCPGMIYNITDITLPTSGQTTVIGDYTYEYTNDGNVSDGNIPVPIEGTVDDPMPTYELLAETVNASDWHDTNTVVITDDNSIIIGCPHDASVTHLGTALSPIGGTLGTVSVDNGVDLLVYDDNLRNLNISKYWTTSLYKPVMLNSGISLMVIPFTENGDVASELGVTPGDSWSLDINDSAPGAMFKYAMGMHPGLSAYYPPVPMGSAALLINGVEMAGTIFGDTATYKLGNDTIYWYTANYNNVPWPAPYGTPEYDAERDSYLATNTVLHFVKGGITSGVVTSLRPAPNSPLTVTTCGTRDSAITGDLQLGIDLALTTEDTTLAGFKVVKDARNGVLRRGAVVERVLPGPGITVTQLPGSPAGQGSVIIGITGDGTNPYSGEFSEIALENAKRGVVGMFPYVKLLGWENNPGKDIKTGFTAKFKIPHTVEAGKYRVLVHATVFGEHGIPDISGAPHYAGLTFDFSILPDYLALMGDASTIHSSFNLRTDLLQLHSPMPVSIKFGTQTPNDGWLYKAFDPFIVHNDHTESDSDGRSYCVLGSPFPSEQQFPELAGSGIVGISPGSMVAVRFARANNPAGLPMYKWPVGFMNLRWTLVKVVGG